MYIIRNHYPESAAGELAFEIAGAIEHAGREVDLRNTSLRDLAEMIQAELDYYAPHLSQKALTNSLRQIPDSPSGNCPA